MAHLPQDTFLHFSPELAKGSRSNLPGQQKYIRHGSLSLSEQTPLCAETQFLKVTPRRLYHIHYGLEVCLLLSGTVVRYFEGCSFVARAGDICLMPFWEPHGWEVTTPARAIVLYFLPSFLGVGTEDDSFWLEMFSVRPDRRPRVTSQKLRAQFLEMGEEMWKEIVKQPRGWTAVVKANLLRLLALLSRSWQLDIPDEERLDVTALGRIMPAMVALHQAPEHKLSVAEAARLCDLSPRQFHRLFLQALGLCFHQFCLRARVASASHLLTSTNLGLESVAERIGFTDASHLRRAFLKFYGCTPGEYRRRFHERA